jgi:hypothetical protein
VGQTTSLADQYKKKTIITVEKHFPYMKKRLVVTSKQVVSLSPIENSIEAIEQRTGKHLLPPLISPSALKSTPVANREEISCNFMDFVLITLVFFYRLSPPLLILSLLNLF